MGVCWRIDIVNFYNVELTLYLPQKESFTVQGKASEKRIRSKNRERVRERVREALKVWHGRG